MRVYNQASKRARRGEVGKDGMGMGRGIWRKLRMGDFRGEEKVETPLAKRSQEAMLGVEIPTGGQGFPNQWGEEDLEGTERKGGPRRGGACPRMKCVSLRAGTGTEHLVGFFSLSQHQGSLGSCFFSL